MLSKKSLSAIWLVLVRGRMIVCELDVTFCLSPYCWLWMRADAFPTLRHRPVAAAPRAGGASWP